MVRRTYVKEKAIPLDLIEIRGDPEVLPGGHYVKKISLGGLYVN